MKTSITRSNNTTHPRRILISGPTPTLQHFKELASRAADLGGTHVVVSDLPKSRWQWERDLSDPYPNWGMLRPSFFKVIVPEELKEWLPVDYAKRNLEILADRSEILKKLGLKALFVGIEPSWLPEEVYLANPEWRGPRVDQPRRARKPYFSPCTDNDEVRSIYKRTVTELCRQVPIENFDLLTNDSGGGLCWATNLYPGTNGPSSCQHRSISERIVRFLDCIQDGVREAGLDPVISLQYGAGAPQALRADVQPTVALLKPGQILHGHTNQGAVITITTGDDQNYNLLYPTVGIPQAVRYASQLSGLSSTPKANLYLRFLLGEPNWVYSMVAKLIKSSSHGIRERWSTLAETVEEELGLGDSNAFLELCQSLDQALAYLSVVFVEPLLLLGLVNQRILTRPLVPFPNELSPEEKNHWRKFQFQANDDKEADDLNNFQGFNPYKGYSGAYTASLNLNKVDEELAKAITLCGSVISSSPEKSREDLSLLKARLNVFRGLVRSARNAIQYQSVLDQTEPDMQPGERATQFPHEGDQRLRKLNAIARNEIDNCSELAKLLEIHPHGLLVKQATKEELEDIFVLPENLIAQLRLKAAIMVRHLNDAHRIYERRQGE